MLICHLLRIKETGVDVFVSPMWPMHVDKHAQPSEPPVDTKMHGSSKVAQLALAMKPRYHFAAIQDVHYERLPYRNHKVRVKTSYNELKRVRTRPDTRP